MRESLKTKLMRYGANLLPAFRASGGRITFISNDIKHVQIKLPLNRKTRNIVGTIYGGSMYSAIDPIYMVMLMKLLGSEYIVWDKSAKIEYKRPGKTELRADFNVSDELLSEIKEELTQSRNTTKIFQINLIDTSGKIVAKIEKTLYIAKQK